MLTYPPRVCERKSLNTSHMFLFLNRTQSLTHIHMHTIALIIYANWVIVYQLAALSPTHTRAHEQHSSHRACARTRSCMHMSTCAREVTQDRSPHCARAACATQHVVVNVMARMQRRGGTSWQTSIAINCCNILTNTVRSEECWSRLGRDPFMIIPSLFWSN